MKRYCKRGHDTFVVGRHQRMCRECRRENDRARYHGGRKKATDGNSQALRRVRARIERTKAQIVALLKGE